VKNSTRRCSPISLQFYRDLQGVTSTYEDQRTFEVLPGIAANADLGHYPICGVVSRHRTIGKFEKLFKSPNFKQEDTLINPLAARLFVMSIMATGAFASPMLYNITFTATAGPTPTAGSFTYDSAAPLGSQFTGFNVVWEGGIFDLTAAANTGEQFTGTDCGTTSSSQSVFAFLSGQKVCANAAVIAWDGGRPRGVEIFDFRNQEISGVGPPEASIAINASTPFSEGQDASGSFSIASASAVPEPSTSVLTLLSGVLLLRARFAAERANRTDQQ
jgi:hypothetical protein